MKCTVVIPTYNRPNHLKRILSYYHQYGNGLPVLIADSSSEENKKLNQETVSSFHDTSFSHLDKYDPSTNPYHKIQDALQQVSTKYCVLCPDDDFVTPSGIQESSEFLDINPDFTTAHGKHEHFMLDTYRGSEPQFLYLKQHSHSYTCSEPKDRLFYEVANYNATSFYTVRRTDFMKMLFAEALKSISFDDFVGSSEYEFSLFFAELTTSWLAAIYGKRKCLDTLFYVREVSTPVHLKATHATWQDHMKDKNHETRKKILSDCLAGHLSKQSGMNLVESYKLVDKAISAFLSVFRKQCNSPMAKINNMIIDLELPKWLDRGIRKLYRATASLFFSPADRAYALTSKYCNDSNQIRLCVLSNARDIYALDP